MANYIVELNRIASATLSVGSIVADATRPRRGKFYDLILGSEATPAGDNVFLWQIQRCTSAGTSTLVTPQPIDPADSSTESDAGENHSVDPTLTPTAIMMSCPLNQRATFRWQATPGFGEIVYPATANSGLALRTPTSGTVAVTATVYYAEQ